jgi:uncharacterized membrane protein YraQ (UPF0718 family)
VRVSADAVHLLAAGAWLGGLFALLALLRSRPHDGFAGEIGRVLMRFSGMGYGAVAALVGTGLINTWCLVPSLAHLATALYGQLLIIKLALFALMLFLAVLVRLTYPAKLVEEARHHPEEGAGHDHGAVAPQRGTFWERLRLHETWVAVASNFVMDWRMLWKDLLLGFLIAGALSAWVPNSAWHVLFPAGLPNWLTVPVHALIGPLIAIITFVCSIGNVPMAAVLWASGVSFGGVLAFLYADLIVVPLLDVYRRYYGWRMAAYIGAVFYCTIVIAAIVMDVAFSGLGLVPKPDPNIREEIVHFSIDYTFWLNILFGIVALWLFRLAAREQPNVDGHMHHGHHLSAKTHKQQN